MRLFLFFLFEVLHYISLFVIRSDFENFQSPKKKYFQVSSCECKFTDQTGFILRHCRSVAASDREVARSTVDAKRRVASLTELANDGGCSMFKYIKTTFHFALNVHEY